MKEFLSNLKFVWQYTTEQKWILIKYILSTIVSIGVNLVIPILSAKIIIYLTDNAFYQLILVAVAIFLVENIRNVIRYVNSFYIQIIYREGLKSLQIELGKEILKLENKTIDENSSGVFIQRLINDIGKLADVFNILTSYIGSIIMRIGVFVAVFLINKVAFLYLVISVVIYFIVERLRVNVKVEKDKKYRKENERVAGFVGEIVRGVRDIKMLNAEHSFMKELESKIINLNNQRYNMQDINRKYIFFGGFVRDLSDLLLILVLVFLITQKELAVASALIIYNYSERVVSLSQDFIGLFEHIKDFNLSCSRVFAIINNEKFKKESFGQKHLDKVKGNFEFKNVYFSYDKNKVLKDLNFKINANETVAFVGKSGAGKTTIFNLLCKMYEVDKGKITIDGMDIKTLDKDSIRGNITIISQDPYIFNLSIKDNLRLVKEDMTEREMIDACKMACLDGFIKKLPDKYDTLIGEGGVNLSGGQKQRLAIARAFLQKTEIILFDEATSALDNETQANIQKAIENLKKDYTILIIAHRLSTVINSDRILFLNNGKIEKEGKHKELLKSSKNYRQLYESDILKED